MIEELSIAQLSLIIKISISLGFATAMSGAIVVLKGESKSIAILAYSSSIGSITVSMITGLSILYLNLIIGVIYGIGCLILLRIVTSTNKVNKELISSTMIAINFSIIIAMLSYIDKNSEIYPINFSRYFLGNIRQLSEDEINFIFYVAVIITVLLLANLQRIVIYIFNKRYLMIYNIKNNIFRLFITISTIVTIVLSIQIVGVIFAPAIIIIPTLASKLVARSIFQLILMSSIFSIVSLFLGISISIKFPIFSAGVVVIIILTIITALILICKLQIKNDRPLPPQYNYSANGEHK